MDQQYISIALNHYKYSEVPFEVLCTVIWKRSNAVFSTSVRCTSIIQTERVYDVIFFHVACQYMDHNVQAGKFEQYKYVFIHTMYILLNGFKLFVLLLSIAIFSNEYGSIADN